MKFGKLSLVVGAMISVSALMQAEVKLISMGSRPGSRSDTKIVIPAGNICGPNRQNCLNNNIEFAEEDHFNLDRKFKEVKSITYERIDPWSGKAVNKCKVVLISKLDRDNKNVRIYFLGDKGCFVYGIRDEKLEKNQEKARDWENLAFVTLEWNEEQRKWNYRDINFKGLGSSETLTPENIKKYEKEIPQEAKDLVEGKK
jgi:hypothetical protein